MTAPPNSHPFRSPDHYAVIGHPVAHSKSPEIHAAFAQQTGQAISYVRLLAPLDGFAQTVDALRAERREVAHEEAIGAHGGASRSARCGGANITVPFKLDAFRYATEFTPRALRAGAVNTLKFDGAVALGDITDGVGLITDIEKNLGFALSGARILLLGAGGAARGVLGNLLDADPSLLAVTNRTIDKAESIASQFNNANQGIKICVMALPDLPKQSFDLIINATSASLSDNLPPVPMSCFAGSSTRPALAYDMMYGRETPFLKLAAAAGARAADGLGMLVEQAAESFYLWRGIRPNTAPVMAFMRAGTDDPAARKPPNQPSPKADLKPNRKP